MPAFAVPGTETDRTATRGEVADVTRRVRAAGRRPVLVAQSSRAAARADRPHRQRQVVDLDTGEHQRLITRPPRGLDPLSVELWLADPTALGPRDLGESAWPRRAATRTSRLA